MRLLIGMVGMLLSIGWVASVYGPMTLSWAETPAVLEAGISKTWSVEMARDEAFRDVSRWYNVSRLQAEDPHMKQHWMARVMKRKRVGNRIITHFPQGMYSVSEEGSLQGMYYTPQGQLFAIDVDDSTEYPIRSYKYGYPGGRLKSVSISPSPGVDFVFAPNGHLMAHWVGDQCYDATGNVTSTRSKSAAHQDKAESRY
jgi:hypothetical protein